ncbi:MAG: hypothetical protein IJZ93_07280 [Clostridia bacterium]|nr:hypothetical protein [Clostridia bacterium]
MKKFIVFILSAIGTVLLCVTFAFSSDGCSEIDKICNICGAVRGSEVEDGVEKFTVVGLRTELAMRETVAAVIDSVVNSTEEIIQSSYDTPKSPKVPETMVKKEDE